MLFFSLSSDSALGPDGFSAIFFKENWQSIGDEFTLAIDYFFKNEYIYFPINATAISLIPKSDNPINIRQFRPISCCNVVYKVISKILTNRLKTLIHLLVGENQSAFIKGRSIQSNILLMHEIVKDYKKQGGSQILCH